MKTKLHDKNESTNSNLNQIVICAIFFLLGSIGYSQSTKCKIFKEGKFQNIENDVVKSEIRRTKKFQFETFGNIEIKLKIIWITDCSYRLIFVEGNDAWWESKQRDDGLTPDLIVQITNIKGNSYLQESKFVGDDEFKYKSKIIKISN